jgi:hypothetical protein
MQLAAGIGVYPYYIWVLRTRIAVKEAIQFFTMTVKVDNEPNLSLLAYLLYKSLDGYNLGTILIFFRGIPISIQIFPCQISPVVAEDDAIRINHRNDIDDIIFQ